MTEPAPHPAPARAAALARASTYLDLGRYGEAVTELTGVLAHRPADGYALCLLSRARLGLDEPHAALRAAEAAIRTDPGNEWALRLASIAHRRLGDPRTSVQVARAAVQAAPHNARCYLNLAMAMAQAKQDLKEARAVADRAVELEPTLVDAHLAVGDVAMADRRRRDARSAYRRALALDPGSSVAHNNLARAELTGRGGGTRLARVAGGFAEALRADPTMDVARRNLEIVCHVFLAKVAWYVMMAGVVSFLDSGDKNPHTRSFFWLGPGLLIVPAYFAARFTRKLSPPLRAHLARWWRADRPRILAVGALAVSACLLVAGGAAPAVRPAFALCAALLSLVAARVLRSDRRRQGVAQRRIRHH